MFKVGDKVKFDMLKGGSYEGVIVEVDEHDKTQAYWIQSGPNRYWPFTETVQLLRRTPIDPAHRDAMYVKMLDIQSAVLRAMDDMEVLIKELKEN